jgi:hypothetical protein
LALISYELNDAFLVGLSDHEDVLARRFPQEFDRGDVNHGRNAGLFQHGHDGDRLAGAGDAEHGKDLVDVDHLARALDGARRDIAVIFQHIFDLAAVDAAGIVGFRNRDLVADRGCDPEQGGWPGQGFDVADQNLGVGDAGIAGDGVAGGQVCAREQQGRSHDMFDHCLLPKKCSLVS